MTQQNVHDGEKLLDALVLAEVLPTLHQKGVVPLIVATDDETFGMAKGDHHLHLQGRNSHQLTGQPARGYPTDAQNAIRLLEHL